MNAHSSSRHIPATCFLAATAAGDVRVNWRGASKASAEVKAGDMISVAGKGRLQVKQAAMTKKGKFSVQMVRYL